MPIAVMPHAVMSSHGRPVMVAMKCNDCDAVSIAAMAAQAWRGR